MTPAHLHLITSHFPVMGTFFGLGLLWLGLLRKSEELKRVALLAFVVVALLALPAYLSGPSASDQLKPSMLGMTMDAGDQHAEIAILALIASLALGVVSVVGLLLFRNDRRLPPGFLVVVVLLALATCAVLGWTANLGAKIRHDELRPRPSVQLFFDAKA